MVITVANHLNVGDEILVLLPAHRDVSRLGALTIALKESHVDATLLANQLKNGVEYYTFYLI